MVSVGLQVAKLRHLELQLNRLTHSCMGVPASSYATLSALSHVEERCRSNMVGRKRDSKNDVLGNYFILSGGYIFS